MEIIAILIALAVGVGVGVPLITMAATDFKKALPPGTEDNPDQIPEPEYEFADDIDPYTPAKNPARLIKVLPKPDSNIARAAKRELSLLDAASKPIIIRKTNFNRQIRKFEEVFAYVNEDIRTMFTVTSITYDVHASAIQTAEKNFWNNINRAIEVMKRFDSKKYKTLNDKLEKEIKYPMTSFDSSIVLHRIEELSQKESLNFSAEEKKDIDTILSQADSLIQDGRQLASREELEKAANIVGEKIKESSPLYSEMCEMETTLSEADEFYDNNNKLIEELQRLSNEFRTITSSKQQNDTDDIVSELARLSENAHRYG